LACAVIDERDTQSTQQLRDANRELSIAVERLEARTDVYDALTVAQAAGLGEHGIADALYELTGFPVALEDPFGNLRSWAGPGRPDPYPKPDTQRRKRVLHALGTSSGASRMRDRISVLVKPHAEILGVLSVVDPHKQVTPDHLFALQYASTVLGLELSHRRNLAEMELSLRRELVDDLVAGTDDDGAYARSEALGHDLRRSHCVVVAQSSAVTSSMLATAAGRAATSLSLDYLQGRHAGLVVLLVVGRPQPAAFHEALTQALAGTSTTAVGIGSQCVVPRAFPGSFDKASRALNVRRRSSFPEGASAYDELGFYHLVDAARPGGAAEGFVRQWLGLLLDYDANKNAQLVQTLSSYLECGGNYDESAAVLHIHRSTLRYRLARISELTNCNLRDVDTRFNLHAATRTWRFLAPIN
jgi:sugar diacid utilization regulator